MSYGRTRRRDRDVVSFADAVENPSSESVPEQVSFSENENKVEAENPVPKVEKVEVKERSKGSSSSSSSSSTSSSSSSSSAPAESAKDEFAHLWSEKASLKENVIAMLESYPPYSFNIFSGKHEKNILAARLTAHEISLLKHDDANQLAFKIYRELRNTQILHPAENLEGEFNKKLIYLIKKIEKEHPSVTESYIPPVTRPALAV